MHYIQTYTNLLFHRWGLKITVLYMYSICMYIIYSIVYLAVFTIRLNQDHVRITSLNGQYLNYLTFRMEVMKMHYSTV